MSKRLLNNAAPELLKTAKYALRRLREAGHVLPDVIDRLHKAVELAEGPNNWSIQFRVTPRTWECIGLMLDETNDGSLLHTRLMDSLRKGLRSTVRRVYVTVDVNVEALRRLRSLLREYDTQTATTRALDRLAAQIDNEVLSKSALEIIAEQGL